MMDLSSYLLRPIQRISKYSLLLQDVLALSASCRPRGLGQETLLTCAQSTCTPDLTSGERERERAEIQAAAELVRFQMRHGNDLLTMDAIRDCDVRRQTSLFFSSACLCSSGVKVLDGTFAPPGEPEGTGPADSPGRVYCFLSEKEVRAPRLPLRRAHPLQQDQEERRGQ